MAAVIRLSRRGSHKNPFYRIVVADQRFPRDGRIIEALGFYNPVARGKQEELRLDLAKADAWVTKGAQPSDTVSQLMARVRGSVSKAP